MLVRRAGSIDAMARGIDAMAGGIDAMAAGIDAMAGGIDAITVSGKDLEHLRQAVPATFQISMYMRACA